MKFQLSWDQYIYLRYLQSSPKSHFSSQKWQLKQISPFSPAVSPVSCHKTGSRIEKLLWMYLCERRVLNWARYNPPIVHYRGIFWYARLWNAFLKVLRDCGFYSLGIPDTPPPFLCRQNAEQWEVCASKCRRVKELHL
jgi:hypothetical protein